MSGWTIALSRASAAGSANTIAPSALNPVSVAIAKTFPATNDPCGRTLYGLVANQDEDQIVSKVDYQVSAKHSMIARCRAQPGSACR